MKWISEPVKPFARGIDTVTRLQTDDCRWLLRNGFEFVVRYLYGSWPMEPDEAKTILCSGLGLITVTPSRSYGWEPDQDSAKVDSQKTLDALSKLGLPRHTVYLDYEGADGPIHSVAKWIDDWSWAVTQAGFEAGLYVGRSPAQLSSSGMWYRPYITRYWRSGSSVPTPDHRGWSMQQLRPLDIRMGPIDVDVNIVEKDHKGETPTWVLQK